MKLKAKNLDIKKLMNGNTELTIEIDDKQNKLINQICDKKQLFNSELEVSIDKYRNKRSGGHNRLFWDMCSELSNHLNNPLLTPYEIYKNLIREYGVSTIHPVDDELLEMEIKAWESRGDGWLTLKLRKSKLEGNYTNVKFWFGSSIYNSKQFWKLVEGLKQECLDNGFDISIYDEQMQYAIKQMEEKEKSYGNN